MGKIKKNSNHYKRLIAFGCSNTYGHGLLDCKALSGWGHGPTPSKYSWPFQLGKMLKVGKVINQGNPGASNKEIAKAITDFDFDKDDLVVVGWSFIERHCIFSKSDVTDSKNILNLGVNYNDRVNKIYQKYFFNDYDRMIETNMFSTLAAKVIKEQAKNYLGFFCCNPKSNENISFQGEIIYDIDYAKILDYCGRAEDEFHPNIKSHCYIAKKLERLLNAQ